MQTTNMDPNPNYLRHIRQRNKSLLQRPQTTNLSSTRKPYKFHTPKTKQNPPN